MRPVLADAAELARRALVELEPEGVGAHLGVSGEDESAATHWFETTLAGYHGWQWAVVVAAPPGAERATVSESALLPGSEALIAPDFLPWDQRIRPGDLSPGDLLAPPADDPRLVPGYLVTGDPVVDEVCEEIGLGRKQVLSLEGRLEAATRWYLEYGPDTDMARAAPSACGHCGFYLPLAGALRESFGVCANAMGADGHTVHVEYGCGAHSDVVAPTGQGSPRYEAYDDAAFDVVPAGEFRTAQGEGAGGVNDSAGGEVTGAVVEHARDAAAGATGAVVDAVASGDDVSAVVLPVGTRDTTVSAEAESAAVAASVVGQAAAEVAAAAVATAVERGVSVGAAMRLDFAGAPDAEAESVAAAVVGQAAEHAAAPFTEPISTADVPAEVARPGAESGSDDPSVTR